MLTVTDLVFLIESDTRHDSHGYMKPLLSVTWSPAHTSTYRRAEKSWQWVLKKRLSSFNVSRGFSHVFIQHTLPRDYTVAVAHVQNPVVPVYTSHSQSGFMEIRIWIWICRCQCLTFYPTDHFELTSLKCISLTPVDFLRYYEQHVMEQSQQH